MVLPYVMGVGNYSNCIKNLIKRMISQILFVLLSPYKEKPYRF